MTHLKVLESTLRDLWICQALLLLYYVEKLKKVEGHRWEAPKGYFTGGKKGPEFTVWLRCTGRDNKEMAEMCNSSWALQISLKCKNRKSAGCFLQLCFAQQGGVCHTWAVAAVAVPFPGAVPWAGMSGWWLIWNLGVGRCYWFQGKGGGGCCPLQHKACLTNRPMTHER